MGLENVLGIVGTFLTISLSINAFFLRGIFLDLNDVKVRIASIFENSKNKDKRLDKLEDEIKEIKAAIRALEIGEK